MVWDRIGNLWTGTLFDANGKPLDHCRLFDRSLARLRLVTQGLDPIACHRAGATLR